MTPNTALALCRAGPPSHQALHGHAPVGGDLGEQGGGRGLIVGEGGGQFYLAAAVLVPAMAHVLQKKTKKTLR